MKVVIVGAGVVGAEIAKNLIEEKNDVVLIEKDPERAKYAASHLDCMVLNDEGNSIHALKKADIENTDLFISVTNSDEVNMITCGLVTSEFKVPLKIARVRNLDYSRVKKLESSFLGIDYIVNSEVETARLVANMVALGTTSDVMLFENSDLQMRNVFIDKSSFFRNKSLREIKSSLHQQFLIAAVLRGNSFIIPSGNTIIQEKDNVYLLATKNELTRVFMETGRKSEKIDKILIVGGGRIGSLICQYLIRTGRKITIVEKNYEICKDLSDKFPDALIINADISGEDLFEEEQLDKYDLIISITNNEELNILSSVYAKSLGTKRAISLVTKSNYFQIARKLEIDSIINPKESTVNAILKYVRRGDIRSIHRLFDGKAEVIEFKIEKETHIPGMKIKELNMPEDTLILSIIRDNDIIIPDGDYIFKEDDIVITIMKKDSVKKWEENFISP